MNKNDYIVEKLFIENATSKLTGKEKNRRKKVVDYIFKEEKSRATSVAYNKEKLEHIINSLIGVGAQIISETPKGSGARKDNIDLIHKKTEIEKEILDKQMPSLVYEQMLQKTNLLERTIITALYSNRKQDYQIAKEQYISESYVWKLRKQAINKIICFDEFF